MLFAVSQMAKKRKIQQRTNRYENVLKILDSGSRELSQLARNEDAFLSTRLLLDNLRSTQSPHPSRLNGTIIPI
jgi:hypothetical protein